MRLLLVFFFQRRGARNSFTILYRVVEIFSKSYNLQSLSIKFLRKFFVSSRFKTLFDCTQAYSVTEHAKSSFVHLHPTNCSAAFAADCAAEVHFKTLWVSGGTSFSCLSNQFHFSVWISNFLRTSYS